MYIMGIRRSNGTFYAMRLGVGYKGGIGYINDRALYHDPITRDEAHAYIDAAFARDLLKNGVIHNTAEWSLYFTHPVSAVTRCDLVEAGLEAVPA